MYAEMAFASDQIIIGGAATPRSVKRVDNAAGKKGIGAC
jgi:hypothetical protein